MKIKHIDKATRFGLVSLGAISALFAITVSAAKADVVLGPTYPVPDGGNTFQTLSTTTDPAFGTAIRQYVINNPSAFTELDWAPADISATMNRTGGVMTAVTINGSTATWTGSTSVTNQFGQILQIQTEFVAKIDSGASWVPSVNLATPTTSASPLAFAQLTSGPFVIEESFLASQNNFATAGTPFALLFNSINELVPNDPNNPSLNFEKTDFAGGFYFAEAVPESSTWAMMILGFAGIGFTAYRKRDQSRQLFRLV